MKCVHCFYWKDLNSCKNELNLEEIERISRSLPDLFFLRLTGGEPFLREDLYQIIRLFHENSSVDRIGISTNGFATSEIIGITDQVVNSLKKLSFEVGISIDNLYEKHDNIRSCPGAFGKAMDTYDRLVKIREKNTNLNIGFLVTVMQDNQYDLNKIFQYLQPKKPDSIGVNIVRGRPKDISQLNIDIEKYDEFRHFINRYNFSNYSNHSLSEKMRLIKTITSQDTIIDTVRSRKARFTCLAGEKIAVLYSGGDVSACELLDSVVGNIGNIRDYNCDFQRLWRTNKRREITRGIKKSECFCTHECFITANLIFRAGKLFQILTRAYCGGDINW
jgi:MoaA/NifB/PqqE/SkfB family radical SAM enzyme